MILLKKTIVLLLFICLSLSAKTIFVYNSIHHPKDKRMLYEIEILKLALDKTIDKYGEYTLVPSKNKMSKKRAIETLKRDKIKNFILKISVTKELLDELAYAKFPIDRGITGYRVSFISPKLKNNPQAYDELEEIKKLKIGQGIGWLDTDILKYNGFNVKSIGGYQSLFYLVSLGRIDFFPRGVNEILDEYKVQNKTIKNLEYDTTFLLKYDFPRFFFAHKSNKEAIKRIEDGLKIAYEDGSLKKIFYKHFKKSIDFLNANKRKVFKLVNPFIKGINVDYKKYNIELN